jgi:hypothetical protein
MPDNHAYPVAQKVAQTDLVHEVISRRSGCWALKRIKDPELSFNAGHSRQYQWFDAEGGIRFCAHFFTIVQNLHDSTRIQSMIFDRFNKWI